MARTLTASDALVCSIGACSGVAYGTFAAIFQTASLDAGTRTLFGFHTSGGTGRMQVYLGGQTVRFWNGASATASTNLITSTSDWYLLVLRKNTGTVAPRISVYNFTTDVWAHEDLSAKADATSPGALGTIRFSYAGAEQFAGEIAARAAWVNSLPWAANTTGDAAIEDTGLHLDLAAWFTAQPSALWLFDQSDVSQAVPDLTGNGAAQSSLTGTAVSTDSVPTLGYGVDLFELRTAPSTGLPPDIEGPENSSTMSGSYQGRR